MQHFWKRIPNGVALEFFWPGEYGPYDLLYYFYHFSPPCIWPDIAAAEALIIVC